MNGEITRLLDQLFESKSTERQDLLEQLMPLVYGELKALARANRYRWQDQRPPGTTSLVHEAYLKLADHPGSSYPSRRHFYCVASRAMRSILIDNARWYQRKKRGGGQPPVELKNEIEMLVSADRSEELLELNEALDRLAERDQRVARIVECRFFGGLTTEETAAALDVSPATVKRGWSFARAWLYQAMQPH